MGAVGGWAAWQWSAAAVAAGEFVVALAGAIGYDNIVQASQTFGVGSCESYLKSPQERLDCFTSLADRALAIFGFSVACAIATFVSYYAFATMRSESGE